MEKTHGGRRCDNRILIVLSTMLFVAGCGGGGGGDGETEPPPPPVAKTFQVSLDEVIAIDRSDSSTVQVSGSSVSGATATMP